MRFVYKQAAQKYAVMPWTLDEYVAKLFPKAEMKRKIARNLSKLGWLTPNYHSPEIDEEQIGLTTPEIAHIVGEDKNSKKVLKNIGRHLSQMNPYVSYCENSSDGRRGRPSRRYYLNDFFWEGFNSREAEKSTGFALKLVDPNGVQHFRVDKRVNDAKEMARKGDQKGVDILIQLLNDNSERARVNAANELALLRESKAIKILITMLDDKSDAIKMVAADALGEIKAQQAVVQLDKMRLNDPDHCVRKSAENALRKIKGDPSPNLCQS